MKRFAAVLMTTAIIMNFQALALIAQEHTDISDLPRQALSEEEKNGIILMREEEKLARDVYLALGDKWNVKTFFNIAKSEQKHMDEMGKLVEKYELQDPVKDDARGVFTDPEMQKLYTELVEQGSGSKMDALKVGALIEDLDIADLESLLKETDNIDIRLVYLNLVKGSRNHMRSFNRQVEKFGGNYEPEYISRDMFNSIIGSPQEQYEISDPNYKYPY